jgi:hypothetical protein
MTTLNPQDFVEVNVNDSTYVQITDEGWKFLRDTVGEDYIRTFIEPKAVELNGDLWYRLRLWTCFELFPANIGDEKFCTRILFERTDINSFCP